MLPTGCDFLARFQGILIAGGVPVPIYPPARLDRLEEYALRQSAILADAGVRILDHGPPRGRRRRACCGATVPSLAEVTTADELAASEPPGTPPRARPPIPRSSSTPRGARATRRASS